jgi:hypothetical protein
MSNACVPARLLTVKLAGSDQRQQLRRQIRIIKAINPAATIVVQATSIIVKFHSEILETGDAPVRIDRVDNAVDGSPDLELPHHPDVGTSGMLAASATFAKEYRPPRRIETGIGKESVAGKEAAAVHGLCGQAAVVTFRVRGQNVSPALQSGGLGFKSSG